jgi:hypothetical protein
MRGRLGRSERRPEPVLCLRRIQHRRHRNRSLFDRRQWSPRRGSLCAAIGKLWEREARALWIDLSERVRLQRGDGEVCRAVAGASFVVGVIVGVGGVVVGLLVELVGIVVGLLVELVGVLVELLELGRIVFMRPGVRAVELSFLRTGHRRIERGPGLEVLRGLRELRVGSELCPRCERLPVGHGVDQRGDVRVRPG